MQFAVPQFTEVEDKLIGPLTLKQFLVVLATAGLDLFFWSLLQFSFFFFIFALPITLAGLALAFGKFNSRPIFFYVGSFISFVAKPQVRIFKREEPNVIIKIEKKTNTDLTRTVAEEPAESRLKKLAYLLDQKVHEEQELIGEPKNG